MALTPVVNGVQPSHLDLNQLINVLQQPSGGQEKGKYHCGGNAYVSGGDISIYVPSLSRGTTAVSVSIDTVDTAPGNMNSPTTLVIDGAGFQVLGQSTAIATSCNAGGNYTLQY